jgi:tetratricopeptide (TPR) repeat protein
MSRQRLEDLHDQASGYYLQGDFRSAAETWRRILADAPDDERALEGVRLCSGLEDAAEPQAAPTPPARASVAETLLDSLEELEDEPGPMSPDGEYDGRESGSSFLDLSDLADDGGPSISSADFGGAIMASPADTGGGVESRAAGAETYVATAELEDVCEAPREFDFGDWPDEEQEVVVVSSEESEDEAEVSGEPEPQPAAMSSSTAAELRHRVRELMDVALAAVERGDKDEALAVLSRLEILDEENEAVRSLKEKIRLEIEADRKHPPGAPPRAEQPAVAVPALEILDLEGDEPAGDRSARTAQARTALAGSAADRPAAATAAPASPAGEPAAQARPESAAAGVVPRQAAAKPAARRIDVLASVRGLAAGLPALPPRAPWIAGAGVAVIGVALAGWLFFGGSDGTEEAGASPAIATAAAGSPMPSTEAGARSETAQRGGEALVPDRRPVEVVVAETLARADRLFDAGDYRGAVVAYDEVLALDPEHERARERLLVAGNRYRDERAATEEWAGALRSFRSGDYRQALHAFYRVPEGKRPPELERYKQNGWYNLGVLALKSGDCRDALSNLNEAQGISANDAGTLTALELARLCSRGERSTPSYQLAVGMLALRSLDD